MRKQLIILTAFLIFAAILSPAQSPAKDGQLQFADLGVCRLVSGKEIENCRLGYRTYGTLNAARSNAVLFPTWFSGVSADLAKFVGPDGLVDSSRCFVVTIDALADGVSSSPSNSTSQHGTAFPAITLQDMVNAEHRLAVETLHLKHVHAVMGLSMGGQQSFEWIVDYPTFMDDAIPIVGSPRPNARDLLLYKSDIDAIEGDPAFEHGHYTKAPAVPEAELIWQLNLTSPTNFARSYSRAQFASEYATWKSNGILPFDANDWVTQLEAIVHLDVGHGGTLEEAARRVRAKVLVVSSEQDNMVNPAPALNFARLIGAKTFLLKSDCGHIATSCEAATLNAVVRAFLDGQ